MLFRSPSSYLAYAVDFDGDGRRDIWNTPADVFASIANYLKGNGWRADEPWGHEVQEPKRLDVPRRTTGCRAMRDMTAVRRVAEWQRLDLSTTTDASLVRTGARRFLVHANYDALLRYNCAHHYALTVGILADLIR